MRRSFVNLTPGQQMIYLQSVAAALAKQIADAHPLHSIGCLNRLRVDRPKFWAALIEIYKSDNYSAFRVLKPQIAAYLRGIR